MRSDADAVYVGGVRMDEYGEFIDDSARRRQTTTMHCDRPAHALDDEPELPGLTDEAKRLLEVAREELEAEEQAALRLCRWRFRGS